jgi:hypothetical protein
MLFHLKKKSPKPPPSTLRHKNSGKVHHHSSEEWTTLFWWRETNFVLSSRYTCRTKLYCCLDREYPSLGRKAFIFKYLRLSTYATKIISSFAYLSSVGYFDAPNNFDWNIRIQRRVYDATLCLVLVSQDAGTNEQWVN